MFGLGLLCVSLGFGSLFCLGFFFVVFIITINSMPCPVEYHYMDAGSILQNDGSVSPEFSGVDRSFLQVLACGAVEGHSTGNTLKP